MTTLSATPIRRKRGRAAALIAAGLLLGAVAAGCRGRPEGFERYIPPPAPARAALAAVLDAWRDGLPPEAGVGPNRDIHVVDKQRKPAQRLVRHEILGEVAAEKARGFAVRLTLENPDERATVRFLVVGIEPLWVFRQEDFEMIAHWMHPMDEPKPADPEKTSPP